MLSAGGLLLALHQRGTVRTCWSRGTTLFEPAGCCHICQGQAQNSFLQFCTGWECSPRHVRTAWGQYQAGAKLKLAMLAGLLTSIPQACKLTRGAQPSKKSQLLPAGTKDLCFNITHPRGTHRHQQVQAHSARHVNMYVYELTSSSSGTMSNRELRRLRFCTLLWRM